MLSSTASTITRKAISSSLLLSITMKIGLQGENVSTSIHIFTSFFFFSSGCHIILDSMQFSWLTLSSVVNRPLQSQYWYEFNYMKKYDYLIKFFIWLNRRKKNVPLSQQHIFTMTYRVKMCDEKLFD